MPETKQFHVADLVTITDGRLLSPRGVGAVYEVVDFVTGQPHMTHHLPRAMDTVGPEVLRQHPWLADVVIPDGIDSMEKVEAWAADAARIHGEMHAVQALPDGAYVGREPIAELREMTGGKPIIGVDPTSGEVADLTAPGSSAADD